MLTWPSLDDDVYLRRSLKQTASKKNIYWSCTLAMLGAVCAIGGFIGLMMGSGTPLWPSWSGSALAFGIGLFDFALFLPLMALLLITRHFTRSIARIEREHAELKQEVDRLRRQLANGQMAD